MSSQLEAVANRIAKAIPIVGWDWSVCAHCNRDLEAMYAVKGSIYDAAAHEPDCAWIALRRALDLKVND